MPNGKLKTWQVVRWLAKHPRHTAEAPETANSFECRASYSPNAYRFEYFCDGVWESDDRPDDRDDWAIRDERGRKLRFKRKRKTRLVGELRSNEDLLAADSNGGAILRNIIRNDSRDAVEVLIRECKT